MDHDQGVDVTLSSYSGPAGRNSLYLHISVELRYDRFDSMDVLHYYRGD